MTAGRRAVRRTWFRYRWLWRWPRRLLAVGWLGFIFSVVLLDLTTGVAAADNCSVFTDCFGQSEAASEAALGLTFLAALSLVVDFIPIVGDVKGLIEMGTGRDLFTGEELAAWERSLGLIGLIPGGDLLRLFKVGADVADTAGSAARGAGALGDLGGTGRGIDGVPPPPGTRGFDGPSPPSPTTAGRGADAGSGTGAGAGRGDGGDFDPFNLGASDGAGSVRPDSPLPPLRANDDALVPATPSGRGTPDVETGGSGARGGSSSPTPGDPPRPPSDPDFSYTRENLDRYAAGDRYVDENLSLRNSDWEPPSDYHKYTPAEANGSFRGADGNSGFEVSDTLAEKSDFEVGDIVEHVNGKPDFSPWSVPGPDGRPPAQFMLPEGARFSNDYQGMKEIWTEMARQNPEAFRNPTAAKEWLSDNGLRPHHFEDGVIQLVPKNIHNPFSHWGGSAASP